jgi:hypothetical protein
MMSYDNLIIKIYFDKFQHGSTGFRFSREDIISAARFLKVRVPKNIGDVIYSYRYRKSLPRVITETLPPTKHWIILGDGNGFYKFQLSDFVYIKPDESSPVTNIVDATPDLLKRYAQGDEQELLTKIRYNNLISVFLDLDCAHSKQSHLRTKIDNYGQIEIDELYIGSSSGDNFVIPVQAKNNADMLGVIQTIQDIIYCSHNFRDLTCRAVSIQFMAAGIIAMFELSMSDDKIEIVREKHYKLTHTHNFIG